MKKFLPKIGLACQWFFGITFILFVIADMGIASKILSVISGLILLPIRPVREFLQKHKIKAKYLIVASVVLIFVAVGIDPTVATDVEPTSETTTSVEENISTTKVVETTSSTNKETTKSAKEVASSVAATTHVVNESNSISQYTGKAYVALNDNKPTFTSADYTTTSFEYYSPLDSLGRCGVCYACIGTDIMPTEERGAIGSVKPTGWHTVKYDCVDGKYLYNRCHLIGYQLTGENANTKNLITGTRYLNINGMLPFENMVADYVKETGNHVLYRVTPDFQGNELVARGVQIEAYSVEDNGDGICFNVYCYNVQPGITINYATGDSSLDNASTTTTTTAVTTTSAVATTKSTTVATTQGSYSSDSQYAYILNTNSKKFHNPSCSAVDKMSEANKSGSNLSRDELIAQGYSPCKICNP